MNDVNAMLRAVIMDPDDDTVRLAYADALLERNRKPEAGSGLTDDVILFERIVTSIEEKWEPQRIDDTPRWWPLPAGVVGWYGRGFYESLECSGEDWLARADELVWHPSQKVECAGCGKCFEGWQIIGATKCPYTGADIPVIDKTRGRCRVSRSCPDTAQPITKVSLTDPPTNSPKIWKLTDRHWMWDDRSWAGTDQRLQWACELFSKEWPWIKFTRADLDSSRSH